MAISFIYFDLGKVLLDFTHERGFQQIAAAADLSEEQVRAAIVDSGLGDRYETGLVSTDEFHREFCSLTGTNASIDKLTIAWGDIFELKPQTVRIASSLVAAGYRIGILSNTCEAHWLWAAQSFGVLSMLFDPVVTSYDAKSMKPDAGIYDLAAKRSGVSADELFFIDDRAENVDAARAHGWTAEVFTTALEFANDLEKHGVVFNR